MADPFLLPSGNLDKGFLSLIRLIRRGLASGETVV